jgi:Zn finger protein HypA/HybF involved in hydrogenase expression
MKKKGMDLIPREAIEAAVKVSFSLGSTIRTLKEKYPNEMGSPRSGSTYSALKATLTLLNIDTKHFTRRSEKSNASRRVKDDDFFTKGNRRNGQWLRHRMISTGKSPDRCFGCGNEGIWREMPLTLQTDHINGDRYDNTLDNLRLLCPNCHSQTSTWAGRNKQSQSEEPQWQRDVNEGRRKNKECTCSACGSAITKQSKTGMCRACYMITTRVVAIRPPLHEIKRMLIEESYEKVGRKFGVHGSAIRYWLMSAEKKEREK